LLQLGLTSKFRPDFQRMKMPLPRFRPVLALDPGDFDFGRAQVQAKPAMRFSPAAISRRAAAGENSPCSMKNADEARLFFQVEIGGGRQVENGREQFATASSASGEVVTETAREVFYLS
jgi:hypothetical protein